jgi:hypothetical protein
VAMSSALPTPIAPPALPVIPLRALVPWAIFGVVIATFLLYFVGAEQGVLSVFSGSVVHEFLHDGRHLLGFPCH